MRTRAVGPGSTWTSRANDRRAAPPGRRRPSGLAAALSALVLGVAGCRIAQAPPTLAVSDSATLFVGARLVPGSGAEPIEDGALLVDGGRIVAVGLRDSLPVPSTTRRVDLTGKTVIPALIGAHGHPGYQRGGTFSSDVYSRDVLIDDLKRAAYFGVGTVVSLGIDPGDLAFEVREETEDGTLGVAHLLLAGRGIGAPNAGPGFATWAGIAYEVTDEAGARAAVREQALRRVDQIKIWVDDRGGRAPSLAEPLYRAIIDEGERVGVPVTAHVYYHADAIRLVDAGIHGFAHMPRDSVVSDDLVASIVREGVFVMPNLGSSERSGQTAPPWTDDPVLLDLLEATVAPEIVERVRASYEGRSEGAVGGARSRYGILEESVGRLAAADARIVLGADTGLQDHFFGYAEQRELELMVRAGMTPAQAIVAATGDAAAYLGRGDLGVLEAGRRADFLVLDANPLDDIRNTRRIAALYLVGSEVDREAISADLLGGR